MALFHSRVKVIKRSSGRSSVGAAAYRAAEKLTDRTTGTTHDYTHRRTPISSEILTPDGAPAWTRDREQLWNRVEKAERRWDAQTAREVEISIPRELSPAAQRATVREYVREQFVSRGMVADVSYHDLGGEQPHAHIMLTMRALDGSDFAKRKDRSWNDRALVGQWREAWANTANRSLAAEGQPERIDHRRLVEQRAEAIQHGDVAAAIRLDRPPQMTRGPAVTHRPDRAPDRTALCAAAEARRMEQIAVAERDAELYEQTGIITADPAAMSSSPHQDYADLQDIRRDLATLARTPAPKPHRQVLGDVHRAPEPPLDLVVLPPKPHRQVLGDVHRAPEPPLDLVVLPPKPHRQVLGDVHRAPEPPLDLVVLPPEPQIAPAAAGATKPITAPPAPIHSAAALADEREERIRIIEDEKRADERAKKPTLRQEMQGVLRDIRLGWQDLSDRRRDRKEREKAHEEQQRQDALDDAPLTDAAPADVPAAAGAVQDPAAAATPAPDAAPAQSLYDNNLNPHRAPDAPAGGVQQLDEDLPERPPPKPAR